MRPQLTGLVDLIRIRPRRIPTHQLGREGDKRLSTCAGVRQLRHNVRKPPRLTAPKFCARPNNRNIAIPPCYLVHAPRVT